MHSSCPVWTEWDLSISLRTRSWCQEELKQSHSYKCTNFLFFIFSFLHMWLKFDRVALSISVSSFKELWQKSERDEKNGIVWTEASSATWRVSLLQHNIFVQIYTCVHESRKLSCRLLWTSGSLMNIFKLQKIFKFDPFFFFGLNIIVAI